MAFERAWPPVGGRLRFPGASCRPAWTGSTQPRAAGEADAAAGGPGLLLRFDLALHDAFGKLVGRPVYQTYNAGLSGGGPGARFLSRPRTRPVSFRGLYPADFLLPGRRATSAPGTWSAGWTRSTRVELTGSEPDDGYAGHAGRLDTTRRSEMPEGQAARQRRGLGL